MQLRILAVKARREGLSFQEFWDRAIPVSPKARRSRDKDREVILRNPGDRLPMIGDPGVSQHVVLWPRDPTGAKIEYSAIISMKDAWRRAYERGPVSPQEQALSVLSGFLDSLGEGNSGLGAEVLLPTS